MGGHQPFLKLRPTERIVPTHSEFGVRSRRSGKVPYAGTLEHAVRRRGHSASSRTAAAHVRNLRMLLFHPTSASGGNPL